MMNTRGHSLTSLSASRSTVPYLIFVLVVSLRAARCLRIPARAVPVHCRVRFENRNPLESFSNFGSKFLGNRTYQILRVELYYFVYNVCKLFENTLYIIM